MHKRKGVERMSKRFFITMFAIACVWVGAGDHVFASATMPVDEQNDAQQPSTERNNSSIDHWWNQWFPNQTEQEVEQVPGEEEPPTEEVSDQEISAFEQEVLTLTNVEREKNGLAPLQLDVKLSEVAREKSNDMAKNGYFDHQSPTYGSPFDMMKQFGITYRTAGENIAMGQRTPAEVVDAWMNSEGHRANILNKDYTHIGIGYIENGNYWTQQFIGK